MESVVINQAVSYYKGKKVFITGHTGFKGSWLLAWLDRAGAAICGYALPADSESLFEAISPQLKFQHVIGDIRDKDSLEKAILAFQPDFIFHMAAQALVRRSYEIPSETFDVNAVGTANVLEAVIKLEKKCSIVVITTDKVYENREADYHYKETDELGGYDPYSASKAATEIVVSSFRNSFFSPAKFKTHQKAIVSVRAGNVIGGGDWNKDRIIPDIVRSLMNNEAVPVRNPTAVRPWQHVLEPLSGYLLIGMLLDRDNATYTGAYNFGPLPDDHLPVRDLVETAIACWGEGSWADRSDPKQVHEAGLLKLDIGKAQTQLNWSPKLNSRQAIEWTINWYRQPKEQQALYTISQIKEFETL